MDRRAMEWIADGALVSLGGECHTRVVQGEDYNEDEIAEILAEFKAFIAENPTPEFTYEWRSENGNGEFSGYMCAEEDLDKALAEFKSELLAGCANNEEREGILSGSFLVTHPVVADQTISLR